MIREQPDRTHVGRLSVPSGQLGLWIFLATATMLFAGFTSAYLVRQAGSDWQPLPVPPLLWLNTGMIVAGSFSFEWGRAQIQVRPAAGYRWIVLTWLLGSGFLLGQVLAWKFLVERGIYLPSNPHSSFFYILTGVHGVHLLGGLIALAVLLLVRNRTSPSQWEYRLKLCATYWHFMGGLWLYLFVVLFVLG